MSRTLILMRHAKSSWDDFSQPDHARALNKRGRIAAVAMGKWLTQKGYLPNEVLCSSAERTRETWDRLGITCDSVRFEDALYHASADLMRAVLQTATGQTVLILGHNPGIAHFAETLATHPADHPRFAHYPTCATTVFTLDIDGWAQISSSQGSILDFAIPREVLAAGDKTS